MAHLYSDDIDIALKLSHLRDMRRSALPLRSESEAFRLLLCVQDALHALIYARSEDTTLADKSLLQS
ncbi:hypothetical protein ACQKKX_09890 [Neorhizobium sp. NPDC001467]|uniref:hypothetical protein n=1 Tax=Neorhizobium sp. NPDC001467 TaxID=3390595 RepID=UPI003D08CC2A